MDLCAAVEKRFIDTLGLNAAAVGRAGFERIVRAAMRRSGIADAAAYLELLSTSPEEFERCLEDLVVPETWFFRDTEPFILLKQHLRETWFPSRPDETVRILSIPCSTGEEPYSIAMTLIEAGIPPRQFHLDAVDISRSALAAAGRAVYGKGSFRHPLTAPQEAFFTGPVGERRVDETVVRTVHFYRENLVEPRLLAGKAPYHIIFCRNVLIYLTDEARRRVIENVGRLLARDGILFTGHAEMGILLQQGFTAVRHARAFACKRTGIGETAPQRLPDGMIPQCDPDPGFQIPPVRAKFGTLAESPAKPPVPPAARSAPRSVAVRTPNPQIPTPPPAAIEALHAEALALADRGLFDAASALCRQHLREQRPYADGYCLLGLIHEAARQSVEAEECYLKALYLDPDHYETLIQLSLLYRQQGDDRKAALCRRRADATGRRPNGTVAS